MKITLNLTKQEIEALKEVLIGHFKMAGFCEMADENPGELAKYAACEKVLKELDK
jgi:hypothetical protein